MVVEISGALLGFSARAGSNPVDPVYSSVCALRILDRINKIYRIKSERILLKIYFVVSFIWLRVPVAPCEISFLERRED